MGLPTNHYVDPSINANSGAGTIGDPYGDLQYALDTITRDGSNGDQINIKAGTDEALTGILSDASYGNAAYTAPLIFRGYTSAANDGGIGGISGSGSYTIWNDGSPTAVWFIDLHLHNSGSNTIIQPCKWSGIINCEIDNTTGAGCHLADQCVFLNNHVHNVGGVGVSPGSYGATIAYNYFANGTNDFSYAIDLDTYINDCHHNIISIDGSSNGIRTVYFNSVANNSILSNGGTGKGILTSQQSQHIFNNLVEGFSGAGGVGIAYHSSEPMMGGGNAVYNCTTKFSGQANLTPDLGDDEELTSSPFEKSGSDTFANRFTYFEPADVGNVRGGSWPASRHDKGAVQHADPAGGGGGGLMRINMNGGMQ